jgi:hypothetical protein
MGWGWLGQRDKPQLDSVKVVKAEGGDESAKPIPAALFPVVDTNPSAAAASGRLGQWILPHFCPILSDDWMQARRSFSSNGLIR